MTDQVIEVPISSYKAKVVKVDTILPIEKADNLVCMMYNGYPFVVSKDVKVGDIVIVFPSDGQLSPEFCKENNLYSDSSLNKDTTKKGYFSTNRRIKAQTFRGQRSEGFVCSPFDFSYLGGKIEFNVGDEFSSLNNKLICEKYYTPQTKAKMAREGVSTKKKREVEYSLREHPDTPQLAYNLDKLPETGMVIITEKVHGTSARTGLVKVKRSNQNFLQKALSTLLRRKFETITSGYELVSGTKHTIINNRADITTPGNTDSYRWDWHNFFSGKLHKGETIYYEICGWDTTGGTIMGSHDIQLMKKRKELPQHFANQMVFSYGAKEWDNYDSALYVPNYQEYTKIFIYRITIETEDHLIEYTYDQLVGRCKELGVQPVKELAMWYQQNGSMFKEVLTSQVKRFIGTNNQSFVDQSHLIEGVVIRIESEGKMKVYKDKNFYFKVLEGIIKDSDTYVDKEEVN